MFQFQAVHSRGVCVFDIEVIKIIIDAVDNSYSEGLSISINTKVDTIDK